MNRHGKCVTEFLFNILIKKRNQWNVKMVF